jgi:hypothetical protein
MLTSLNVAEDATLKTAVVWCDEQGVTSVSDLVEYDLVYDFVRHLGLRTRPRRRQRLASRREKQHLRPPRR